MTEARLPVPPTIEDLSGLRNEGFVRKWRKPVIVVGFLILFCLVWNGFLAVWYALAFAVEDPPAMMLWFPLLHVAVGLALMYFVLATILNRTEFLVDGSTLTLKHRPLYWPGSRQIPRSDISQIFINETQAGHRRRGAIYYSLHWMNPENRAQRLVGGIGDRSEAVYIERRLEELLGIRDEAVVGAITSRSPDA